MKSAFRQWFNRQFGPRPSKKEVWVLEADVRSLVWQLEKAKLVLRKTSLWHSLHDAALKSWVAAPEIKR